MKMRPKDTDMKIRMSPSLGLLTVVFQLVCLESRNKASNFQDFDKYNVF